MAPTTATPERNHWKPNVTAAAPPLPGTAVSVDPTLAVPLIVGTSQPAATGAVAAEVLVTVV
ncbi:hypothetical protein [Arthrobacter sp. UYCu712]|uniref:hypothetical protein n=1 Tax=Arthrobacter sp. UYCu712 TaxID=3156340 RepID=UPI00339B47FE